MPKAACSRAHLLLSPELPFLGVLLSQALHGPSKTFPTTFALPSASIDKHSGLFTGREEAKPAKLGLSEAS